MKIEVYSSKEMLRSFNYKDSMGCVLTSFENFVAISAHGHTLWFKESELTHDINRVVWAVMKNADFTEGRGPMHLHKLYKNFDDAVSYVMGQSGIYGSTQGVHNYPGISINGNAYIVSGFNGYDIKPVLVE